VKAQPGQVLKLYDHFKPGVPELAALLPAPLARRLQAWDQRRGQRGLAPWALSLKLPTHSVFGWAALRVLASLKGLRRRGSRFAQEQAQIDTWLATLEAATLEHPVLGLEVALAARLVKGYGDTHTRGQQRLAHLLVHVARGPAPPLERAQALHSAREAALADDSGQALDRALAQRGAPTLPVREQVIRFVARKPTKSTGAHPDVRSSPPL
jgi:indolepyruvate ferredoxin oxidoreductase, beta subunit